MLRPLVLDVLDLLLPVGLGALSFAIGLRFHHLPRMVRVGLVFFAVSVVAGGATSLAGLVPDRIGQMVSLIGGGTMLLAWTALLLIGTAWSAPNRRYSRAFLSCIVGITGCLLLIEGSGRLWWRFAAPAAWHNVPDVHGRVRQSSGITCGPAAATMLLHRHGITASEGEMAYLAGTSLFGSDAWQLAAALNRRISSHGLIAVTRRSDYDACVGRREPFVARIRKPSFGHAVLVTWMVPKLLQFVDPLDGLETEVSQGEFKKIWDGTVIVIERRAE